MRRTKVVFCLFAATVSGSAFAAEECMPKWNQKMEQLRASQRAYSCEIAATLEECEANMGLGKAAQYLAAGGLGGTMMKEAGQRIRDKNFRVCQIASLNYFDLIVSKAWASPGVCTHPDFINQRRIRNTADLMIEEHKRILAGVNQVAEQKQQALNALEATSDPKVRAALFEEQVKAAKASLANAAEQVTAEHNTLMQSLGSRDINAREARAMYDATSTWQNLSMELNRHAPQHRVYAEVGGISADLRKKLLADGVGAERADQLSDMLERAGRAEEERSRAKNYSKALHNDPRVKESQLKVQGAREAVENFKPPKVTTTGPSQEDLAAARKALVETQALAKNLVRRGDDLAKLRQGAVMPMSKAEVKAVAELLGDVMPKEILKDPSHAAIRKGIWDIQNAAKFMGEITPSPHKNAGIANFLRQVTPYASQVRRSMIKGATVAAGAVFAGVASAGELALYSGSVNCASMGPEKFYKRDLETCKVDMSFANPVNQKLAELESEELCRLAKDNPEILEMIESNYRTYYSSTTKVACGPPLQATYTDGLSVTYSKDKLIYKLKESAEPIEMTYNRFGVEEGTLVKMDAGVMGSDGKLAHATETVPWGKKTTTAHYKYNPFEKRYKMNVRPMVVEAAACCSGDGVQPPDDECASRYGIKKQALDPSGKTGTSGRAIR